MGTFHVFLLSSGSAALSCIHCMFLELSSMWGKQEYYLVKLHIDDLKLSLQINCFGTSLHFKRVIIAQLSIIVPRTVGENITKVVPCELSLEIGNSVC